MKSKLTALALILIVTVVAAIPATAAPAAGPCVAGGGYDPACDANQDGQITVTDIELTAGHWNETGTWTGGGDGWSLTGNAGTDPASNFVGTNDGQNLVIQPGSGWVGIGTTAPQSKLNVNGGTAWFQGNSTPLPATAGEGVAMGYSAPRGAGYLFAFDYGTDTPKNLLLQYGSGSVGIGVSGLYDLHGKLEIATDAFGHAIYTNSPGGAGLYVNAADIGIDTTGSLLAGYFRGDIVVEGYCVGCLQAIFGVNAGDHALQPGDVVSIQAVAPTNFDTGPALWQVTQAQPGQAGVGVVAGRAELSTETEHRPTETGKRLVPREGAAQPGEYVTIVYSGPMQVKVAAGETAIAAGTRLTAATDGTVRALGTVKVQLAGGEGTADISESAPVVGLALEPAKDGMVWVLVNPQ